MDHVETSNRPTTLLEMAKITVDTPLSQSVLILIDYQYEYLDGKLPLFEIKNAIKEAQKLLLRAREAKIPVIHVVHKGRPGGLFDPVTRTGEIIGDLKPIDGEKVVYKTLPNAFAATELEKTIHEVSTTKHLVIAGLMTHMCLSSTVRAAIDHGFMTTVVASTTTTRDLRDSKGGSLKATIIKEAELAALQDRFARIEETPEKLK